MLSYLAAGIIRGRILLNGDSTKSSRIPADSVLIVQLQDISLTDAAAVRLSAVMMKDLFAFPLAFQLDLPTKRMVKGLSYSLSAQIRQGDTLLFINDQNIPVPVTDDSPLMIDIPVISISQGSLSIRNDCQSNEEPLSI
jgi:uncharacterized lipoprotein YbaY